MTKRFTDTEIWNKDWFLELNMKQKLLTKFLFDACDCAGFYKISWVKLKFFFGEEVTKEDFEKLHFVKFLKDDFIFLENFILFQCKIKSLNDLNPNNNAHRGILRKLEEFSPLLAPSEPLVSPLLAPSEPLASPFNGVIGRRKKEEGNISLESLETKEERKENLTKEKKEENKRFDNVAYLQANREKKKDPFTNPILDSFFVAYEENCPNLCRLGYERKNRELIELLNDFVYEIDCDIGFFKKLCQKANDLKTIANKPIDFKSLIRNYIGIENGKYIEKSNYDFVGELFKR